MPKLRRFLTISILTLACSYLLLVGAACTFQRSLLYFPDGAVVQPNPAGPPIRVEHLTTSDGQHLIAWWLPPAAGKPVLLFFGGNGDSLIGDSDRFAHAAQVGAGMLAVAYEGYSGSTGAPTEAGLHRDGEAGYAWVAARYPTSQIVIEGFSLGTGVAVRVAAAHPARALILEAPYTSTAEVGAERMPFLPVQWLMWDRFASRDFIAKVHMPLLIVHGDADETIPFHFGRELFALANEPKTFVTIPGGHHNDLTEHGFYDHVWPFLGGSLPPGSGGH
ncbi:MAG TPA: alpha/beta hydrolase [Caulobacteraceae bacterium]|nr:alpha/beta hydrolase [Caulobacteraceae bacterium]